MQPTFGTLDEASGSARCQGPGDQRCCRLSLRWKSQGSSAGLRTSVLEEPVSNLQELADAGPQHQWRPHRGLPRGQSCPIQMFQNGRCNRYRKVPGGLLVERRSIRMYWMYRRGCWSLPQVSTSHLLMLSGGNVTTWRCPPGMVAFSTPERHYVALSEARRCSVLDSRVLWPRKTDIHHEAVWFMIYIDVYVTPEFALGVFSPPQQMALKHPDTGDNHRVRPHPRD